MATHFKLRELSLALVLHAATPLCAQSITNGDFENGNTGWTGCIVETGTLPTYGGSGTGRVAEVDGNFDPAATDDRILCQTISGFTVGAAYTFTFDATRRGAGTPPATVSVTVTINGGALSSTVTRTGGWNMVRQQLNFIASQTTHTLTITPNFTNSHGMIFDNLVIAWAGGLPVEFLAFEAYPAAHDVLVDWITASELQCAYFAVERSTGAEWSTVVTIPGAGNSTQVLNYSARDTNPLSGISYYRLHQVDLDGADSYSDVRSVDLTGDQQVLIWPNPATDHVRVGGDRRGVQFTDVMGRHYPSRTIGDACSLDVVALPSGQYTVNSADGTVIGRFVKE